MQLQTLQFAIIATMISITQAFVKIDVSKLTTTTPVIPNETSEATVTTTLPITQSNFAIDKTVDSITTSQNTTVNSRSKPETNQTEIKVIRPILDRHIPRTSRIKISSDTYYCACDLMINLCDTICCCDNDCSDDMLSVFVCDENHLGIYNYEFDAGLTSCEIKNELFCVVEKDIVSRNEIFDLSLLNKRRKFKWPTAFANDWTNDVNRHSYPKWRFRLNI